jgi:hypothetical protein
MHDQMRAAAQTALTKRLPNGLSDFSGRKAIFFVELYRLA